MISKQHKIYILPTASGSIILLTLFISFLISLSFGNPLAISCSFFFISTTILSAYSTHSHLKSINLSLTQHQVYTFANEETSVSASIQSSFPKELISLWHDKKKISFYPSIAQSNSANSFLLYFSVPERGIKNINEITISSVYPFSIFKAWVKRPIQLKIIAAAAPKGNKELPHCATSNQAQVGENYLNKYIEDYYLGHRTYTPGDSWRRIDWPRHTRDKSLLTKVFASYQADSVCISLEELEKSNLSQQESLEQISQWVKICSIKHMPFELKLHQQAIPAGLGQTHLEKVLLSLASFDQGSTP